MEDDTGVDDVGVTKEFSTQWHIELEDDDDGEGIHVHQHVDDVEEVGAAAGEVAVGEEEERMTYATKDFIPKERVVSPAEERVSPDRDEDDRGDIPMTQIPSIDSLLGDIYELKYQLVQANSCMYRYQAERLILQREG